VSNCAVVLSTIDLDLCMLGPSKAWHRRCRRLQYPNPPQLPLGLLARVGRIMEQLGQIQWKHSDPTRRIRRNVVSATCHQDSTNSPIKCFSK
jgi:hypothetical protein